MTTEDDGDDPEPIDDFEGDTDAYSASDEDDDAESGSHSIEEGDREVSAEATITLDDSVAEKWSEFLSERDEADEVDEFVDGLEDTSVSGLAEGLDPELASHLEHITSTDGKSRRESIVAADTDGPEWGMSEPDLSDAASYETFSLEVNQERANKLLKAVYREIQKRHNKHYEVDELILGLPQYKVLEPWAQAEHRQSIEAVLPVGEVTLVPGPMIHPVVDNRVLFTEYMRERDE